MDGQVMKSEVEFKKGFMDNFDKLGYSGITRDNKGKFPDFIMLKMGEEIKVELETLASHFVLHKHSFDKVDEVVCIKKDMTLPIKIIEVPTVKDIIISPFRCLLLDSKGAKEWGNKSVLCYSIKYEDRLRIVSATIDPKIRILIEKLVKSGKYRNKSHVIEEAIEILNEEVKNKKGK